MEITSDQVTQAYDTLVALLEEIGLENYLFDVEPREGQWGVNIECAAEDGWATFQLSASAEYIARGKDDAVLHQFLLEEWSEALTCCKKKKVHTS